MENILFTYELLLIWVTANERGKYSNDTNTEILLAKQHMVYWTPLSVLLSYA